MSLSANDETEIIQLNLLDAINSPADVKQLKRSQLKDLAGEIRRAIVEVVACNGGHLAPSLGAVDLAVALHYVFDTPTDKIIWDVGHQAYAHKLLTGRRTAFKTIRQYEGLSGFTRMSESPYDAFTTGHSSTSISAALGIAAAKQINNEKAKVVAVIGDGSMTAGLAYEGLNQAGDVHKDKNLIVILNDNEMSISPNVGALSSFLSRTLSARKLQDLRKEIGDFLKSVPKIGDDMYQWAKRSEESFKTFVTPGMLFEAFNFDYFGPINGHNLDHLIDILLNIRNIQGPVLLHVITQKGKGYRPAEENPVYFHGCGRFEVATGECIKAQVQPPSYTQIFGETMVALARQDPRIVAVTAAMPEGTGLARFSQYFPKRFFDVGIAEQHGVTFAAGLATEGLKPVVAIYSTFLQRAYDQVIHDVCVEALPVVFALDRGGIVGEDGATHHGLFDLAYLRSLPQMVVMAPKDENELRRMLLTAIRHDGPIALRYPRGSAPGVAIEEEIRPLDIGKAEVLRESDADEVLIIAIGQTVSEALLAHDRLRQEGIRVAVINARFVKPLDRDLIMAWAEQIPRMITVEDNTRQGGFGSAVLEALVESGLTHFRLERLGIDDVFVSHGPQQLLRQVHAIDADAIVAAAKRLVPQTLLQASAGPG
jgi:1-deoxy-D-xylulose-5-phosphate synthase